MEQFLQSQSDQELQELVDHLSTEHVCRWLRNQLLKIIKDEINDRKDKDFILIREQLWKAKLN